MTPEFAGGFIACALAASMPALADTSVIETGINETAWKIDQGTTPDELGYPFDRISERIDLRLAERGYERMSLSLQFAREKLIETKTMVARAEAGFAWVSAGLHKDYLQRAGDALADIESAEKSRRRLQLSDELLEHIQFALKDYARQFVDLREFALRSLVEEALVQFNLHYANLTEKQRADIEAKRRDVAGLIAQMRNLDGLRQGPRLPADK